MPLSQNFTHVTLGDDGALTVNGASVPPNATDTIFVSLVHSGEIHTVSATNPTSSKWTATFAAGAPAFEAGEPVFVVGVAMRPAPCDPFVWQGSFAIEATTDNVKGQADA